MTVRGFAGVPVMRGYHVANHNAEADAVSGPWSSPAAAARMIAGPNDLARSRMDVQCYGKDAADAWDLAYAVPV